MWRCDNMKSNNVDNKTATPTNDELAQRLQSLPLELCSLIYDFTFSTSNNHVCHINLNYQPPAILQVDRASRSLATQSFYNNSTFSFAINTKSNEPREPFMITDLTLLPKRENPAYWWLLSLAPTSRKLLRRVVIICTINTMEYAVIHAGLWFENIGLKEEFLDVMETERGTGVLLELNELSKDEC